MNTVALRFFVRLRETRASIPLNSLDFSPASARARLPPAIIVPRNAGTYIRARVSRGIKAPIFSNSNNSEGFPRQGDRVVSRRLGLRTERRKTTGRILEERGERRKGTRDKGDFEQLLLNVAALINHRSEDSNGIFLRSFLSLVRGEEKDPGRSRIQVENFQSDPGN